MHNIRAVYVNQSFGQSGSPLLASRAVGAVRALRLRLGAAPAQALPNEAQARARGAVPNEPGMTAPLRPVDRGVVGVLRHARWSPARRARASEESATKGPGASPGPGSDILHAVVAPAATPATAALAVAFCSWSPAWCSAPSCSPWAVKGRAPS